MTVQREGKKQKNQTALVSLSPKGALLKITTYIVNNMHTKHCLTERKGRV